jgi:PDZ domain-containing protein/aspartyl protease
LRISLFWVNGLCAVGALFVVASGAKTDNPSQAVDPNLILEQFDFDREAGLILLPVELNGKKHHFGLDTGATVSIYDLSLRPLLGQPKETAEVETSNGVMQVEMFHPPRARPGKLDLPTGGYVLAANLRKCRQVAGLPIDGILGMDFLGKYVVRVDFDEEKVFFLRSPCQGAGHPVRIFYQKGLPYADARLPGHEQPVPFLIDTGLSGYGSGDLRPDLCETLVALHRMKRVGKGLVQTGSGAGKESRLRLESLTVGKITHRGLIFSSPSQDNSLGLNFWSRHLVTFDFPRCVVYLEKGGRFDAPDGLDRSGLHILRGGGRTVVDSVDEGSAAAQSGIRPGDELVRVGGLNAAECRLWSLRRLLCSEGKKVQMTVKRGSEELAVILPLRKGQ